MNLGTMRTAVRTRIGNPSTDGFYSDAQLNDLINEALQVISTEDDWPWLQASETITTTAGDATYAPNANWVRTKELHIVNFDPMVLLSLAEINDYGNYQGQPDAYTIYEEQIVFAPVPATVYSIIHQYVRQEPELTVDGQEPLMPDQFHYAIVAYAAYLAQTRAGYDNRGQVELGAYKDWYRRMVSFRRRSQRPVKPRVRPGSWL